MPISYIEKLKDPRWQKKRLEIFQRDKWQCQNCGCDTESLHIHHFHYFLNNEPWEYLDSSLITLCESCHNIIGTDYNYVGTPLENRYIHAITSFAVHQCDTCYHFQEFKHCSCRSYYDAKSDGSCNDWTPIKRI